MPEENCRSIAVDDRGVVWVGTLGGGLCKLQGAAWQQYTVANSYLVNNYVWAIGLDPTSLKFWFGTNGGVSLYQISEQ